MTDNVVRDLIHMVGFVRLMVEQGKLDKIREDGDAIMVSGFLEGPSSLGWPPSNLTGPEEQAWIRRKREERGYV